MKNLKRKKPDLVDAAGLGEDEEEKGKIQHTDKPDLVNNAGLGEEEEEEEGKLQPTGNKPDLVNAGLGKEEEEIKAQFLQNLICIAEELTQKFIAEGRSFDER